MGIFSGTGVNPSLKGVATNTVALQAGQVATITPAGWYAVRCGLYTVVQQFDPITLTWRTIGGGETAGGVEYIYSDGVNYRLANQTGCAVGAVITTAGSGYTTAPVVTPSAGGSKWTAIVGGAISQTVTVTNGGVNYTYPPIVVITAPPAGGIQATAYATLTSGVVSSVTVVDQGAGYASAPTISFVNDPREGLNGTTVGYGAAAVATLTGAGTVTGLLCVDHGNPIATSGTTATSIPTLSFSPASTTAATVIMCWSILNPVTAGYNAGAGITSPVALITGVDQLSATPVYRNVTTQKSLVKTRNATIWNPTTGTALGALGANVTLDGGIYMGTPLAVVEASASTTVTTAPVVTFVMGGINDVSYLTQM